MSKSLILLVVGLVCIGLSVLGIQVGQYNLFELGVGLSFASFLPSRSL